MATSNPDHILLNQSGNSPSSAAFREDQTIYSKQLINDSNFDLPLSSSPWNKTNEGDSRDMNGAIVDAQTNSTVIGNQATFSLMNAPPQSGQWTQMYNPSYIAPLYPQWNGVNSPAIDAFGCRANHTWSEGANQAPSVWWVRNVTTPVNMSDYVITSANISAVVNASVNRNVDVLNITLDNPEGVNPATPQGPPFDFVRFYVRIADLNLENIYECAYNRTSDLGWYNVTIPIDRTNMADTYLTTVSQDALIFYLNQVLAYDHYNFTIILGIDIYCADNCNSDNDTFNMLRIKSASLNFTCQKKVDQYSAINWAETGFMINESDYIGSGYQVNVSVLNATLNFRYKITQTWPVTSPNSEFRVYVNNYLHGETVKISNGTTTEYQGVKGGEGFDVSSLILLNQNLSIRIQIIMLDTFQLSQNCSVLIDNVTLDVFFLATVRTTIPDTQLQLVGSTNIAVPWNNSFTVTANYTRVNEGAGIPGANITIGWIDTYNVTDAGGGLYTIQCNNSVTSANQHYNLQILAEAYGNESKSYTADIQIIERPTHLHLFMNQVNSTTLPEITVSWNQTVNITAFYYDTASTENLTGASVDLNGIDLNPNAVTSSVIGTAYQFLVNSSYFVVGSHFISLLGSMANYSLASILITLKVTARSTFLSIVRNSLNVTQASELNVPKTGTITLNINYFDGEYGIALDNYNVSLQGLASQYYTITPATATNLVIDTTNLDLGVYIVSIIAGKTNYTQLSHSYQINVNQIQTSITTGDSKTTYKVTPNGDLEITLVVTDTDFNQPISGCELTYSWRFGSGAFTETSTGVYKATIKNIPEGENSLYISAYKGPTYHFEAKTISIVAVASGEGLPPWVVYMLVGAMVALSVLFIQYQRVWKYPPHIRKLRNVTRDLKSGKLEKEGTPLTFRSEEVSFADTYLDTTKQLLSVNAQAQLKTKYLSKKSTSTGEREIEARFTPTPKIQEAPPQPAPTTTVNLPPVPSSPSEPLKTASSAAKPPPQPAPTTISPPIAPIPERFLELTKEKPAPTMKTPAQVKELPPVKTLPQIKDLPSKPTTKPTPKPEEKPAENAGDEKK